MERPNMLKQTVNEYKNLLKYREYDFDNHHYEVIGIGKESIKAFMDNETETPKWFRFDKPEGKYLARKLIKTFNNVIWNKVVQAKIEAQSEYCKTHGVPDFTPKDGFCHTCSNQIYADATDENGEIISKGKSYESAKEEHITGCPHCYRSFCD